MRLYILRHGKAERDSDSGRDADRPLADRGRAQAEGLAKLFARNPPKALQPPPATVLSSPAARADSTARIIAAGLKLKVQHEEALALDAAFNDLLTLAEKLTGAGAPALLVGHNPLLSR